MLIDNVVTLFAAVASTVMMLGTGLPGTFPATVASTGADPMVVIPVAQAPSKGRGLILIFKEDVLNPDGEAGFRATLDPEIKVSTG